MSIFQEYVAIKVHSLFFTENKGFDISCKVSHLHDI